MNGAEKFLVPVAKMTGPWHDPCILSEVRQSRKSPSELIVKKANPLVYRKGRSFQLR